MGTTSIVDDAREAAVRNDVYRWLRHVRVRLGSNYHRNTVIAEIRRWNFLRESLSRSEIRERKSVDAMNSSRKSFTASRESGEFVGVPRGETEKVRKGRFSAVIERIAGKKGVDGSRTSGTPRRNAGPRSP